MAVISGIPQQTGVAEEVDFGRMIYPILKDRCLSCHSAPYVDVRNGRTKKPKGGVRLDTKEHLLKGYLDDDDNLVKSIVPGVPDKSPLYTTTTLPADHDDIMPAKGDPLTKEQQGLLKQWIADGAKFGDFKIPTYVHANAKK